MEKLSEKVISKITQEKIIPIPKWQLLLKSKFIWLMAIVGVLFGSISIALSLYLIINPAEYLPQKVMYSQIWQVVRTFPFFWLLLILIFVYVAYHNFLHTEDGYKWKTAKILAGTVLSSLVLGVILLISGFAPILNGFFLRHVPSYTNFGDRRGVMWMAPDEGRLAGRINIVDTRMSAIEISDLRGEYWKVTYDSKTISRTDISVGEMVKILGVRTGESSFSAQEFRPWQGQGMMRNMMQGNRGEMRINR